MNQRIKILLSLAVCLIPGFSVFSQSGLILYGNRDNPLYNPSFLNEGVLNEVTVFPLSSFETDISLPFSFHQLFTSQQNGNYAIDLGLLTQKASIHNTLMMNATAGYLSYTTNIKSQRWMFRFSEQAVAAVQFEKDLINFLDKGNSSYKGEWFETNLPLRFTHYSTLQANTSRTVTDQLKIGWAAKLYFGKSGVNSRTNFKLFTHENAEYIQVIQSGKVLASLPVDRNINPKGHVNGWQITPSLTPLNYLFQFRNPGLGIDVGIDYKYNKNWNFSAALIDLGFIAWFGNINSMNIEGEYLWDGFDISELAQYRYNDQFFNEIRNTSLADSFLFSALKPSDQPFLTLAPLKFIVETNYIISNQFNFSAINQIVLFNGMLRESVLLMGNYLIGEKYNFSAGLSYINHSVLNLPVGLNYKGNRFIATISINNLWGLFLPAFSSSHGGSFYLAYKFRFSPEEEQNKIYPFYQPFHFKKKKNNKLDLPESQ